MAGIAAWKQSSTLSSIVCEQTILPFLANNLNPPMISDLIIIFIFKEFPVN